MVRWTWIVCGSILALMAPAAHAESPDEMIAAASALYEARKFSEASAKLDAFLVAAPKHPKAGAAALTLGRARAQLKQYPLAMSAFERAIGTKEAAITVPAQLGLGEAAIYSKSWQKAVSSLEPAMKSGLKPDQAPTVLYWLGQAHFQLKHYPQSEESYLRLAKEFPKSDLADAASFGAGLCAMRQGRPEDAFTAFKIVIEKFRRSPDRAQAMLLSAGLHSQAKRHAEARNLYEAILREYNGKSEEAQTLVAAEEALVSTLLDMEDYGAAAGRIDRMLSRLGSADPQRFRALLSLGHCRYRQRQYEQANSAYSDASKSSDEAIAWEGLYWSGNALAALNRPKDAAEQFGVATTRFANHPATPRALLRLGEMQLKAKQDADATTSFQAILDRFPSSAQAADARKALSGLTNSITDAAQLAAALKKLPPGERYAGTLRLAYLHIEAQRFTEASTLLAPLVKTEASPTQISEANYLLGVAWEGQHKPALAGTAFQESIKLGPKERWSADVLVRIAWLQLSGKKAAEAEKSANAALELKPVGEIASQATQALLQAKLALQKWDAALQVCADLLGQSPSPEVASVALYSQGYVLEQLGKLDEAVRAWDQLLQRYPKTAYAAEALLRAGDVRNRTEKYEEARQRYARLVDEFGGSQFTTEARFKLGSVLYNLGRAGEAAEQFDRVSMDKGAVDLVPEALYWSGVAHEKAGKKSEAISRLSRLVRDYPKHSRVSNAKIRLAALKATY